ncbi:MAG: hypothetical protein JWR49_1415 [Tardiphaga sp.]|jgi:hypothetical protein|nr:hypothetical protein [Tardiphaga sp.]
MTRKYLVAAVVGAALLMSGAVAHADAYQPGEFLMLDLNRAALSPKPLGPPARFEPVPIEAKADTKAGPVKAAPTPKVARAPVAKAAARKNVARHRSNPLDANAADTRVQVWPCRTGGICNWQK